MPNRYRTKFTRGQIARVLELRVAGRSVRDIARRTGVHYSYVCRLTKNAALPKLSVQLMSERARRACIILLEREEKELTARLSQVTQSLARFRAGPPTTDAFEPFRLDPQLPGGGA